MRILQIEDDHATAQSVELMLKSEGFNVHTTDLGEEGVDLAKHYQHEAILLDLNLPDIGGLDVLRQLRAAKVSVPVLIVTGSSQIETKVRAFALGADDYLTKPFHRDELVARLRAVIRRSRGLSQSVVTAGDILVNLDAKTVSVRGNPVHLTGKEYQVLEVLALRKNSNVNKESLMNCLYGGMDEPDLKIVDVYVCKIRHKLKAFGASGHIETEWGRGYKLTDHPSVPLESMAIIKGPTTRSRLIARLLEGNANFTHLCASAPDVQPSSVRATLSALVRDRRITNIGGWHGALYALTAAGLKEAGAVEQAA